MTDMIPRAEADARVAAVIDWYDGLVGESTGVAGYHLNGDAAGWGEFDRPTCPDDARSVLEAMLEEARRDAVETVRQAIWDKLNGSQLAEQLCDTIDAAIRAEAEE
jgi:hypothetical protein